MGFNLINYRSFYLNVGNGFSCNIYDTLHLLTTEVGNSNALSSACFHLLFHRFPHAYYVSGVVKLDATVFTARKVDGRFFVGVFKSDRKMNQI